MDHDFTARLTFLRPRRLRWRGEFRYADDPADVRWIGWPVWAEQELLDGERLVGIRILDRTLAREVHAARLAAGVEIELTEGSLVVARGWVVDVGSPDGGAIGE